jgi:hypothetical protein
MQCQTLKPGVECLFMKKTGCGYNGGRCYEVVENCDGCTRIMVVEAGKFCTSFPYPAQRWQTAGCSMATHVKKAVKQEEQKINPLKASKRAAGKK